MENLNESGENRVDYIAKKQVNSSVPSLPITSEITENSVIVTGEDGVEVRLNDGEWFNSPHTFTGLNGNTEYTVYARFKATDSKLPSVISEGVKFNTLKITKSEAPSVPVVSDITENSVIVTGEYGVEVKIGSGEWFNSPHTFTGLNEGTNYVAYSRYKETNTHNASGLSIGSSFTTTIIPREPSKFNYTGNVQTFVAPATGIYQLEVWGAQGWSGSNMGGKGGYSSGKIYLKSSEKINIYIGGMGTVAIGSYNPSGGGFNGGGHGQNNSSTGNAGGGGGGTDIRLNGDSLSNRIIVAGGGGGSTNNSSSTGGNGGALIGEDGNRGDNHIDRGKGGTQFKAGQNGGLGFCGSANSTMTPWNGGGGGGLYGGGVSLAHRGGGGGSGYIGGVTNGTMTSGTNTGHGKAIITYIGN